MRKFINLFRLNRRRMEQDLDRELCYHLDRRVQDLMREGVPENEAHRMAVVEFGGIPQVQEEVRDAWLSRWLHDLIRDVRHAAQMLGKSPGFTSVAVLSLALGIGANTTIFSAIDALLLRPLPYWNPDRLISVQNTRENLGGGELHVSTAEVNLWRQQDQVFDAVEATSLPDITAMSGFGEPDRVGMVAVTAGFFPLLGATPALGRFPTVDDLGSRPLVLSYEFWRRHFAGNPTILGRKLFVDNGLWTVVGVLSPRFDFFGQGKADVYRLLPVKPGNNHWLVGVGRLKTGVTGEQAEVAMNIVARHAEETLPASERGWGVRIHPLQEFLFGSLRTLLFPLLGTVVFVLLIACSNIANLLLSRAALRGKEMGIRAALGASRFRLMRQMLTEGVLLSLLGGLLGLLLSAGGIRSFIALAPRSFPQSGAMTIDVRVLAFTFVVSVLTGIAFGLAPALRLSAVDLNDSVKGGSPGSGRASRQPTRNVLVVAEIALAMVLLVGAGLMINTVVRVLRTNPGFSSDQLLTLEVRLLGKKYFDTSAYAKTGLDLVTPQVPLFSNQLLDRVRALPAVQAAALIDWFPMIENRGGSFAGFTISGDSADHRRGVPYNAISEDYFHVMQIPLLRGRLFTEHDNESSPWGVIINEAMARKFWADAEATESRLHLSLVVRTAAEPESLIPSLRGAIRELDKDAPIFGIKTVRQTVSDSAAVPRFVAQLLTGFAALALLLASIGIYGVISYSVNERRHEIGLRMALGAQTGQVVNLILKHGLVLALVGVVIGLVGAMLATPLLGAFLYGVKPHDPLTLGLGTLFLILITMLATYLPARGAAKADPMVTLRHE